MKFVRILYLVVILLMVLGRLTAGAQEMKGATPEERAQSLTTWMKDFLNLEDVQMEKIQSINLRFAQRMAENFEQYKSDQKALIKGGSAIDKDHTAQLADALRPAQWSKYERYKNEHKVSPHERYKMYRTMGGGD